MSERRRAHNSTLPASDTPLPRYTRIKSSGKRRKAYRHLTDEPFRAFIRSQPCILWGKPGHRCGPSEAAHVENADRGVADRGHLVPLCRMGHTRSPLSWHMLGPASFCERWGVTLDGLRALAARLTEAYDGGR